MKLRKAIKRVMALGTGATMVGATIMGAMGAADLANYPEPFVQDGLFNAHIVLGESGQTPDVIGAVEIATSLQVASRTAVGSGGSGSTVSVSKGVRIESGSQPLRLGLNFSGLGRTTVTSSDMDILKDINFQDEEGTGLTGKMKIILPAAFVAYGRSVPSSAQDKDEPTLHVNFDSTNPEYSLVVDFPTPVDPTNLSNEVLSLFGKEFTTGASTSEMTATKITLFSAAIDQTFTAGQEAIVDVNGQKVTVRVIGVNTQSSTPTATISVNGETESLTRGQTKTIGGQRVYVRDVQAYTQPVGGGGARLFIGSEKVVLNNGGSVEKGTDAKTVDGTEVTITSSGGKISQMMINVTPSDFDQKYGALLEGQEFVDPVFGSFKWIFAKPGANPDLMAAGKSKVRFVPSDDRLRMEFKNKGGDQYALDIAKGNGTDGNDNVLMMRANGDEAKNLITAASGQVKRNDYFVIGSGNNEYQRILKLVSMRNTSSDREITVQDVATGGSSQTWSFDVATSTGTMTYDGNTYTFTATFTGSPLSTSDGYITSASTTNMIYTDNDNLIILPSNSHLHTGDILDSGSNGSGAFGPGGSKVALNVSILERTGFSAGAKADDYGVITTLWAYTNGRSGTDIYLLTDPTYTRTAANGGGLSLGDTGGAYSLLFESSGSNSYDKSDLTPWGTFIKYNSDSNSQLVELYMPSEQSSYNVFVAPVNAQTTSTGGGESGTLYATNPINVGAAVLPNEVGNIAQVNAIVVGGPCVNSAAAQLMGNPTNCAEGFEDGKGVLRLFEHPSGKVSLLVAGYSAQDTRRAARVLAQYEDFQSTGKLQGTNVEVSGVKADFTDTVVGAAMVGPSPTPASPTPTPTPAPNTTGNTTNGTM